MLSILLSIYLEMKLLDYIVVLYLIFWEIIKLFPTEAAPFWVPSSSVLGIQLLHVLNKICFFLFLIFILFYFLLIEAIQIGARWYLPVVLSCISIMINYKHLFISLLANCYLLWRYVYSHNIVSCMCITLYKWINDCLKF